MKNSQKITSKSEFLWKKIRPIITIFWKNSRKMGSKTTIYSKIVSKNYFLTHSILSIAILQNISIKSLFGKIFSYKKNFLSSFKSMKNSTLQNSKASNSTLQPQKSQKLLCWVHTSSNMHSTRVNIFKKFLCQKILGTCRESNVAKTVWLWRIFYG